MRLRKVKNADVIINEGKYFISDPYQYKNRWNELFNNDYPIHIEIGMGKGDFIINNAIKYPNINFIGIEKFDSVIVRAIQKSNEFELDNLKLIREDAINLSEIFDKEIDCIYLNFSDPWPKDRHYKRRLSSDVFLNIYDKVFKNIPHIIMKTDNIDLFNFSINSLKEHGYFFDEFTNDLHNEKIDSIPTEYEIKFSNLGYKINYVDAYKKSK